MIKTGKKIKHNLATLPLGIKRMKFELDARAALLAMQRGVCNEQHIVDLWVLADLCEKLNGDEKHIKTHCLSVKKLCEAIHNKTCDGLAGASITASANILITWIHGQDNIKLSRIAAKEINRINA